MNNVTHKLLLSLFYLQNKDKYIDDIFTDIEFKFKGIKISDFVIQPSKRLYCERLRDWVLWENYSDDNISEFRYNCGDCFKTFDMNDYINFEDLI